MLECWCRDDRQRGLHDESPGRAARVFGFTRRANLMRRVTRFQRVAARHSNLHDHPRGGEMRTELPSQAHIKFERGSALCGIVSVGVAIASVGNTSRSSIMFSVQTTEHGFYAEHR